MASELSVELPLTLRPASAEVELVARAAAGDHDAYATLVRPHERIAFRVAPTRAVDLAGALVSHRAGS